MTTSRRGAVSREAAETAIALRKGNRSTSWREAVRRSERRVGRWEETPRSAEAEEACSEGFRAEQEPEQNSVD